VVEKANTTYDLVPGQNSWLAVGIALPDGGSTRANEDLVDGLPAEFKVNTAKLILFKGGTEANATYFGEYPLTPATFNNETNDNVPEGNQEGDSSDGFGEITSTSTRYVTEISNPNLGAEDKLWAYCILNYDGNATGIDATGKTFAEFSRQIFKAIGIGTEANGQGAINDKGLVMTSVPIADKAGGVSDPAGATITTLSEVQAEAIYETKEEAAKTDNPLTCIYVERAAVKVELKNSVEKIKDSDVAFAVTGWYLGNVNNNESGYYNTRQFSTDWLSYINNNAPTNTKYRMLGRTGFWNTGTHTPTGYRTYFGEDVNYDGNTGLIFQTLTDADYAAFNATGDNITYTYENTMDENSMIYQNTTYVGIKAQIGDGDDFYVEEGQPGTKLDDAAAIGIRVKANASATFDAAVAAINAAISSDLSATTTNSDNEIIPASTIIAAAEVEANAIDEVSYDLDAKVTLGAVDATTAEQAYTYQIVIKNITAKKSGAEVTLTDAQKTAVENAVKALAGVADIITPTDRTTDAKFFKYADGVSYYSVRIAHFGGTDLPSGDKNFNNGETPWSAPSEAYNNYDKIYPKDGQSLHTTSINYGTSRADAWLGRWGIVRNNWYVLDIKEVEGFGSPVPEDYSGTGIGNTPDDNPERSYFIAAEIHILPWAKRYQSVKF